VRILTNTSFGFCVKAKFEALDHHRRRACLLVALALLETGGRKGGRDEEEVDGSVVVVVAGVELRVNPDRGTDARSLARSRLVKRVQRSW